MKKNKLIAAILFGVLAIVQAFGLTFIFGNPVSQIPIICFIEVAAFVAYIAACVHFLKTAEIAVTNGEKRSIAALAVMYFAVIALNMQIITQMLALAFFQIAPTLTEKPSTGIAMLIFRTALLFAALAFTILNETQRTATIEFDMPIDAKTLESAEVIEQIEEKLDDAEQ